MRMTMLLSKFITYPIIFLSTFCVNEKSLKGKKNMENLSQANLIKIIMDSRQELSDRINAVKEISKSGNSKFILELKNVLTRARPDPISIENWDPVAAERVIDLYILEALHKLGDDSQIDRIGTLVAQAGTILQGPDNELYNASMVIKSIGRREPIKQLIDLTRNDNPQVVRNAVVTLNKLNLSGSPIGGSTNSVLSVSKKFTFQFTRLKEEMEIVADLSKGKIQLSEGVKTFLKTNDYERGDVKRENVSLPEMVERDLAILDFDYFLEKEKVIICTHQEAGKRWQDWWIRYHDSFTFK